MHESETHDPVWLSVVKLVGAVAVVVLSAQVLIPAVTEVATRLSIPESIIAATLVAFGTSLPELVTSITAARRGHGELAVGNIVGADILNVLFVSGAAAAATPGGLHAAPHFFLVLFPAMLFVLAVFRVGIYFSGKEMRRPFGYVLLGAYAVYLLVSYLAPGPTPD
jgi:cation:H+ antiporter